MFFKLLLSLVIAVPALSAVFAQATDPPSLLWIGLIIIVSGYHRNLLGEADTPPWNKIVLPVRESMRVRYTIWGVPLAPARRVRHGARMRERAVASPMRARIIEALPAALRWLARKVGA